MGIPIASTLGMLGDNLTKRKSALPLAGRVVTAWADGLDLPHGGKTIIYTGQMWQMVPAINAMGHQLAQYEEKEADGMFRMVRRLNRLVNLTSFLARTTAAEREVYYERLRNIARLLKAAGVKFGYLYEDDWYAGALAYDEGLDPAFRAHAQRVAEMLKRHGVERLITVDPHTTNMLRSIYPKVVPGFHVKVTSYLEVLAEHPPKTVRPLDSTVTLHDSCVYARYEGVIEPPRELLMHGGAKLVQPDLEKGLTFCCGGPAETLFPTKSGKIAAQRIEQLKACSPNVVTACPLCLASLSRAAPKDVHVRDISDYLVKAYLPAAKA